MFRTTFVTLAATASFSLLACQLTAQQLAEGYAEITTVLPAGASNVLTTNAGLVYFDGFDLMLQVTGSSPQPLLTFASFTFGSFTAAIGTTRVLFGESSNGTIWNLPLDGQPPQQIANVPFNYDAILLDDNRALVSAKTGGFAAADNDVMFVDLITGQTQLLAQFPGASGPLAVDDNGDVYYATAPASFPAPAGTVSILRLTRTVIDNAILNNQVLGVGDTQLVITGLDAAGDLAFDNDGDLFYVDWFSNQIGEINDADGPAATLQATLIDYAGSGLNGSVLQFLPQAIPGAQVFEPFQPTGGQLRVHETDYVSISQLRSVTSRRPQLTASASSPIPTGNFALTTSDGPANGIGLLLFATTTATGPISLTLPGFEQPLHIDASLTTTSIIVPVTFDGFGQTVLNINNPGFASAINALAVTVCISTLGTIGSSTGLAMQIGQ